MQQITRTVTSKGQVTIPKQVRDRLGISPEDKITFLIDDAGRVELRPTSFQWKDLRGSLPAIPGKESIAFDDMFEEAMQERGDDLMTGKWG